MPHKFKFRNRHGFQHIIIEKLKSLANTSDVRCRHACIIINRRSGEIVAEGHNYHYHKKPRGPWKKAGKWSMHAEEAAYRNFFKNFRRHQHRRDDVFDLIVVRRDPSGCPGYKNSKPCHKCYSKLKKLKEKDVISRVYYSIDSESDDLCDSIVEETIV